MASDLVKMIKSRGYWQVTIRPATFDAKRIPRVFDLAPIVEKCAVELRGWDYPHIAQQMPIHRDQDWAGQEFAWEYHLEAWRLYQSGLFTHLSSVRHDWMERVTIMREERPPAPNTILSVADTLYTFTEIFEFAARLAASAAGDEHMHIDVQLGNLAGRELQLDVPKRLGFVYSRKAQLHEFRCEPLDIDRPSLLAKSRDFALDSASDLFQRFNWDPTVDTLRDMRAELLRQ